MIDYEKRIKSHNQFLVDIQAKYMYGNILKQCDWFVKIAKLNETTLLSNELMHTELCSI